MELVSCLNSPNAIESCAQLHDSEIRHLITKHPNAYVQRSTLVSLFPFPRWPGVTTSGILNTDVAFYTCQIGVVCATCSIILVFLSNFIPSKISFFNVLIFLMFNIYVIGWSSERTFEERCIFSEHRCANHRLNYLTGPNRTTRYVRIVRAFFVVAKGAGMRMDYPAARLTFRTFTPLQLTRPTGGHLAEFEQTRQVTDRVNQWLQVTGESPARLCVAILLWKGNVEELSNIKFGCFVF